MNRHLDMVALTGDLSEIELGGWKIRLQRENIFECHPRRRQISEFQQSGAKSQLRGDRVRRQYERGAKRFRCLSRISGGEQPAALLD
jgi:hypothetical protein